ncbi:hypothetical protein TNIN_400561 [Trichonephila inaurata madagascariensis]|uniref:Uncharacterized protein n=1 Tax=Trichonephila inaurata madagascariensis TaxID=2747483 RepID=A0A8X6X2L4_9ARAC|nr:hypothetical protein TNIN_400561 [Trichonephila inaurata madagascariensis]
MSDDRILWNLKKGLVSLRIDSTVFFGLTLKAFRRRDASAGSYRRWSVTAPPERRVLMGWETAVGGPRLDRRRLCLEVDLDRRFVRNAFASSSQRE